MTKKLNKFHIILAVIIILAVFVPWHQARAWCITVDSCAMDIGKMILGWVAAAIGWAAQAFDSFIQWQITGGVFGIDAVKGSWAIIRDFVNLFFILVLIIMAFGTIFSIQKYTWKEMLAPFLIAALFINFSLVIGQYIIAISNGLAGVFLRTMTESGSLSLKFATGFSQANIITATTGPAGGIVVEAADILTNSAATLVFGIIWLVIVFLAFLSAFIFSIVRIFVLMFLLIISPIAWFGYALPNLRKAAWSDWWKNFLCWCFFLPFYLFFLMFAVIFINFRGQMSTVPNSSSVTLGSLTLNNLVVYGVSLVFLVGGLAMAKKLACASGSAAASIFSKIETRVRKYAPGAAYVRGGVAGLKERGVEIQEKGLFGIGGAQKARIQEAEAKGFVAGIRGLGRVPGAREEGARVAMAEIEKDAKRVRELLLRTPAEQQKAFLEAEKSKKGIAGQAAELEFVKQGYSKLEDYQKAAERYGGENSAFMRQYTENLKQAKLSDLFKDSDTELRMARGGDKGEIVELANLRRELYKDLAKRNQISNLKDYKEAKQLFGSIPTEFKSFLDSIKPEYIVGTKEARQDAISNRTLGDTELERKLVEFMKDKKEINNIPLRQAALDIVKSGTTAGKDTIEGRNIINEINKFNPIINIEANLREEKGVPVGPLDEESQNSIVRELSDKISEMESGDIRKLSGDFFKNPAAQKAFHQIFKNDAEGLSELLKGASKEMRIALKDLASGGTPGGGTAKRKVGFIS